MNQNKFEELLLHQLSEISERMSSMENRIDERMSSMDERMSSMENRIDERMSSMDERMSSMENRIDERMSSMETRLSSLEQGMAWVRGKLERRGEFWMDIKSWIAIGVAIAAVIFAWLK